MSGAAKGCCSGICGFILLGGFLVLIYWAPFQPHHIRATVDSATLSNLTVSAAAVSYHLAVSLSLYNPSVRVNIYYDTIDAQLRFRDAVIGPAANDTSPSEFYQRRKTTDVVKLEFAGRGVGVAGDVAGELEKEMKGDGPVTLELDVRVRVRYVFRAFKLRQKPRIRCSLSIPVKAKGRGGGVGGALTSGDRCRVKY
ncbi:NDR1/HIN1-like protein 3 [Phragmites australis]|uniref:NDR1/HIN1-like protein 3 n=1 Tax=Phragmites australis TaxID=29695 RepID=UPI002D78C87C|nr:NDR1/HIN1-like protein 3 [Phragmites australis]